MLRANRITTHGTRPPTAKLYRTARCTVAPFSWGKEDPDLRGLTARAVPYRNAHARVRLTLGSGASCHPRGGVLRCSSLDRCSPAQSAGDRRRGFLARSAATVGRQSLRAEFMAHSTGLTQRPRQRPRDTAFGSIWQPDGGG